MANVKSQNKQEFFELLADPDMSMQLEKLLVNAYNLGQYPLNEEIEIEQIKRFYYDTQGTFNNNSVFKVFTFSNENIAEFFKNIDMTNKKLATVGSSFDQAMYAILKGSTDVTVVDLNFFTKYFSELKYAAVKNLKQEEFVRFFKETKQNSRLQIGMICEYKLYQKISHDLCKETQMFWDFLYLEGNEDLFYELFYLMNMQSFYLRATDYYKLQNILKTKDIKMNFIVADYFDFPNALTKKYDVVLLTNLYYYLSHYMGKGEEFMATLKKLYEQNLNDGGIIQVTSTFEVEGKKEKKLKKDMKWFKKQIGVDDVFYIKNAGMKEASSLIVKKNDEKSKEKGMSSFGE